MLGGLGAVAFVKTWRGEKCIQLGAAQVGEVGIEGDGSGRATVRGRGRTGPPVAFDHVDFCFML